MKYLKLSCMLVAILTVVLAACAAPTPEVIEKEVVVEKKVIETVEIEKEVVVEKEVTVEVTRVVEKEVPVELEEVQADLGNLFPNGIGEVDCSGAKLVVATQTGPQIAGPVQNRWQQWSEKTGGTVEVQTFPFGELFEKIRAGYLTGASPFDIIIYAADWAGDIMGPGYVLEVPQNVQDQVGYKYLIPTYRDRILSWAGEVYALPYDGDAHMIYFRRDLLTNPEYQADFKAKYGYDLPVPPKTWEQYYDIAQFFNGKTVEGETVYGAGTAFRRGGQSYWTFLGLAASYAKAPNDPSYFFDAATMEPRINNPGFVEALKQYIALAEAGPPDVVNWDVGNIRNEFPAGTIALGIDWGDVGPIAADPKSSIVSGKWGSALEPGVNKYWDSQQGKWAEEYNQAPYLAFGGWVQSVSASTKNPECAFDFAAFMGNKNMSALLTVTPQTGVNPHFFSDVNNVEPWVEMGMTETEAKEYLDAVRDIIGHPNAVVDLRITGAAEYFDALDTQLARAVAGEVSPQEALDKVAEDWDAITNRIGRDQQKKLYRQMLGLPTEKVAVEEVQADLGNLFPNGIGEVDCSGAKLVVATQTGPQIAGPVQNRWQQWSEKTGGTVEVQTFPFGELFEKIRAGYLTGASPFDIIIYAADWAGDIMGPGYVLEVPQNVQDQVGYKYLIPTYRDRILSWAGEVYALPYDGDAHMIYFRRDLLTNPEYQADFKAKYGYDLPVPPKTWEQYYDIAQFFNGKTVEGETVYGAGTAFRRGGQSYWTFLGLAASYAKAPNDPSYFFDAATMEPRINNPGFVEALKQYIALAEAGPPDVVNWDVGNIRNEFPAGTIALGIDWGDVGPIAADPKSSIVSGKWGSALEPGVNKYWDSQQGKWAEEYNQAPYLAFGGWVQSVSASTKNPECAFDFAAFMGNKNMSALLTVTPQTGVNPHFFSDVNNVEPWVEMGMTETEAKEYLDAVRDIIGHPNAVVDLRITGAAEYFDALDTQLARAVAGEVSPQEALDKVAEDWDAITNRIGRDQQKKLYRQMLGLPTE